MGFVATFQPDSRPLPLGYSDARACTAALRHWKNADFYARGTPLGAVTMRKVVTTDASLTGWGATQEGKTGHHVLVRCDNTTAVAYINRQDSLRSSKLHLLAHKLLVWSRRVFLSLRATHVPGILNVGAYLLSRGNPIYGIGVFIRR
ncbi:hypothetical protein F2P79_025411 [Pimephales promelas]|nr:hypothetical protein F2P79_025411 [Pimephales promelas]